MWYTIKVEGALRDLKKSLRKSYKTAEKLILKSFRHSHRLHRDM